jgi:hypothetical protein
MSYIGWAVKQMHNGVEVRRDAWKSLRWICIMPGLDLPSYNSQSPGSKVNDRTAAFIGNNAPLHCQPYIAAYTTDDLWQPGWLASQGDLLTVDWEAA